MKMNQFRSILAVATVATSITANSLPSQAFTLDELWQFLNRGSDNPPSSPSSPPQFNGASNEAPQPGGFNNDTPSPSPTTPISNPAPKQNNSNPYTSVPAQTISPEQQPTTQRLAASCVNANGHYPEIIDRDSSDSSVSVGRRPFRVFQKFNLSSYSGSSFEKTCRIVRHPSSGKVRVGLGIPDNSTLVSARVSIYVDGREKAGGVVTVGQARAFTFDIAGASSFAIIVKRLNGDGYIYSIPVKAPL
jgi:hypothetical protein